MALGDIVQVLSTKDFPVKNNQPPTLRKRNKNYVLLLAPMPESVVVAVRSIYINDAGIIDDSHTDFLIFDTIASKDLAMVHWGGNIFVVNANDETAKQHIWTVSCSALGVIPDDTTDYLEIGTASNRNLRSDLLKIHGTVLVVGQCLALSPRHIQTVIVSGDGLMSDHHEDQMDFDQHPSLHRLRHVSGNIIADLYQSAGRNWIETFSCNSSGDLSAEKIDSWDPIASTVKVMALCKVSDTVFAAFWKEPDDAAYIRTFSISADGTITESFLDFEKVDEDVGGHLAMIEMGQGYFLLGYRFSSSILRIKTYYISEAGAIQDGHISTHDISITDCTHLFFEHLNGDIWTIIYGSPATTLNLDTFEIVTPTEGVPHHEMIMGMGP